MGRTTHVTDDERQPGARDERHLDTAFRLGARLCRDALWAGNRCTWFGPSLETFEDRLVVAHRAYGPELYAGTSGIALFLGRLFGFTGERLFRVTAEGALRHALSRAESIAPRDRAGNFTGYTGVAAVADLLGEIFQAQRYRDDTGRLIDALARSDATDLGVDVVNGFAGAIPALLGLHRRRGDGRLLDLAVRFGERLLERATRSDDGWSWRTLADVPARHHLTGFAHGAAGIAWSLMELAAATDEPAFREGGKEGFRYVRGWFNAERQNWPDFRNPHQRATDKDGTSSYAVTWCHGAPGIGMALLRAARITGDPAYRDEALAAIRTTRAALERAPAESEDWSLCHGVAGNAELLLLAGDEAGRDAASLAGRLGARGRERFEQPRAPWPCGVPGGGEAPNLMVGTAGIGYFYLRLYDPARVPSVLLPSVAHDPRAG